MVAEDYLEITEDQSYDGKKDYYIGQHEPLGGSSI